jgi:hypothetical protein
MTAMENLRSCDEIRGFRVRPRWKTSVAVTKFGVSKSPESETAHAWGVSMSGRGGNRPSTSVRNLGVSMSGRNGTRPKAQPWETRGFHVRPQRKPPKIASVGNRRPRTETAQNRTCGKPRASMSGRDGRNRASVGNSGFPAPDAREPVRARKIRFSCVLSRQETTQVRENQGFPCRSRKNNRARAGKSEVSESVEKPTVRWGAHLADVPCVALGWPTLVRPY